ncbi:MAG: hypothetical protein LBC18_04555 [Opitutaceae bacterium]|jgi:hypothetical protein|nr:hypothetical protein [Opitutaceae bacterium]
MKKIELEMPVASSAEKLAAGEGGMRDSGRVESDAGLAVFAGKNLALQPARLVEAPHPGRRLRALRLERARPLVARHRRHPAHPPPPDSPEIALSTWIDLEEPDGPPAGEPTDAQRQRVRSTNRSKTLSRVTSVSKPEPSKVRQLQTI